MTKNKYQKPAMLVIEADFEQQILTGSVKNVTTTGLNEDNLHKDNTQGNSWNDAMSRHSVWDEEDEEE